MFRFLKQPPIWSLFFSRDFYRLVSTEQLKGSYPKRKWKDLLSQERPNLCLCFTRPSMICTLSSCLHSLVLQHWCSHPAFPPQCGVLSAPGTFLSHDLWTCCSFCLEFSFPGCLHGSLPHVIGSLVKEHLLSAYFLGIFSQGFLLPSLQYFFTLVFITI